MSLLLQVDLPNLYRRGKVRDTFLLDGHLLMVATDRVSAFDVVLPSGIPDKGCVLNQLSAFWFQRTAHIIPNHLVEVVDDIRLLNSYPRPNTCYLYPRYLEGRSMIVEKAERLDVECVVRGYLAGSAWEEYQERGSVAGIPLRPVLKEGAKLERPLFTPTTKAAAGHDQPITLEEMADMVGRGLTREIEEKSLQVYAFAEEYARTRGIIIADTKMEFGLLGGKLILIDELLTPDSSRFWDAAQYRVGQRQPSFDKQPLRDWLVASGWNREPPAPALPPEIIEETAERYREAYRCLTGRTLKHVFS